MEKRLLSFLKAKKFLHKHQFGFSSKHTVEQACAVLLNLIYSALESGEVPAAIFLDLRKEFDTLIHRILLGNLSCIPYMLKLIEDQF